MAKKYNKILKQFSKLLIDDNDPECLKYRQTHISPTQCFICYYISSYQITCPYCHVNYLYCSKCYKNMEVSTMLFTGSMCLFCRRSQNLKIIKQLRIHIPVLGNDYYYDRGIFDYFDGLYKSMYKLDKLPSELIITICLKCDRKNWLAILLINKKINKILTPVLELKNSRTMQLFVKGFSGSTKTITNICQFDTIGWFAYQFIVKDHDGLWTGKKGEKDLVNWYRFIYNGQQLVNEKKLLDYNMNNESTIHAVGRLGPEIKILKADLKYRKWLSEI
jgi:hypothetical protein